MLSSYLPLLQYSFQTTKYPIFTVPTQSYFFNFRESESYSGACGAGSQTLGHSVPPGSGQTSGKRGMLSSGSPFCSEIMWRKGSGDEGRWKKKQPSHA